MVPRLLKPNRLKPITKTNLTFFALQPDGGHLREETSTILFLLYCHLEVFSDISVVEVIHFVNHAYG